MMVRSDPDPIIAEARRARQDHDRLEKEQIALENRMVDTIQDISTAQGLRDIQKALAAVRQDLGQAPHYEGSLLQAARQRARILAAWMVEDAGNDQALTQAVRNIMDLPLFVEPAGLTVKKSADFDSEGTWDVTDGVNHDQIFRDPESREWYSMADRAAADRPSQLFAIGQTRKEALDTLRSRWAGESQSPETAEDVQQQAEAKPDRRVDHERRKRIDEMSPDEMRKALHTDDQTGLQNRRAYEEAEKLPFQAMLDIDSLKWVNDNLGYQAGDQLISVIGEALKASGLADQAFRTGGDEFVLQGKTKKELDSAAQKAYEYLEENQIVYTDKGGTECTFTGSFSYGTGRTIEEAQAALKRDKSQRELEGARASRGDVPPRLNTRESRRDIEREEEAAPAAQEETGDSGSDVQGGLGEFEPGSILGIAYSGKALGLSGNIYYTRGEPEKIYYAVVEQDQITPSHNPLNQYEPYPNYPYRNERDYRREPAEQDKVSRHSVRFVPGYLIGKPPDASQGPMVVDSRGNVLGGNSRFMTLMLMRSRNMKGAQAYLDMLLDRAAEFGIDRSVIQGMENPVLVRVYADNLTHEQAQLRVNMLNPNIQATKNIVTEGLAKSAFVSDRTFELMASELADFKSLRDYMGSGRSKAMIDALVEDGVIDEARLGELVNKKTGLLSKQGRDFVEAVLRGKVVQDADVLDALSDTQIMNKIDAALPALARMKALKNHWDITGLLNKALDEIVRFKTGDHDSLHAYFHSTEVKGDLMSAVGRPSPRTGPSRNPLVQSLAIALDSLKQGDFKSVTNKYLGEARKWSRKARGIKAMDEMEIIRQQPEIFAQSFIDSLQLLDRHGEAVDMTRLREAALSIGIKRAKRAVRGPEAAQPPPAQQPGDQAPVAEASEAEVATEAPVAETAPEAPAEAPVETTQEQPPAQQPETRETAPEAPATVESLLEEFDYNIEAMRDEQNRLAMGADQGDAVQARLGQLHHAIEELHNRRLSTIKELKRRLDTHFQTHDEKINLFSHIQYWVDGKSDIPSRVVGGEKGKPMRPGKDGSPSAASRKKAKRLANKNKQPYAVMALFDRADIPRAVMLVELPQLRNRWDGASMGSTLLDEHLHMYGLEGRLEIDQIVYPDNWSEISQDYRLIDHVRQPEQTPGAVTEQQDTQQPVAQEQETVQPETQQAEVLEDDKVYTPEQASGMVKWIKLDDGSHQGDFKGMRYGRVYDRHKRDGIMTARNMERYETSDGQRHDDLRAAKKHERDTEIMTRLVEDGYVQSQATERPAPHYYRLRPGDKPSGVRADDVRAALAGVREYSAQAMRDVKVVQSIEELPIGAMVPLLEDGAQGSTPAMYVPETGEIYFIADNLSSPEQAVTIGLVHEMEHKGWDNVRQGLTRRTGRVDQARKQVDNALDKIYGQHKAEVDALGEGRYADAYGQLSPEQRQRRMTEEYIALNQDKFQDSKWYDRYVAAVTRLVRAVADALGYKINISNAEVRDVMRQARESVRREIREVPGRAERAPGEGVYVPAMSVQMDRFNVFSQMEQVLSRQGMLPKSAKKSRMIEAIRSHMGKFKQTELEESGLIEHIESMDKDVVTRQEILDYMDMNRIVLEEVQLSQRTAPDRLNYDLQEEGFAVFTDDHGQTIGSMQARRNEDGVWQLVDIWSETVEAEAATLEELASSPDVIASVVGDSDNVTDVTGPRFNKPDLALPGGENYREVLLTLPSREPAKGTSKPQWLIDTGRAENLTEAVRLADSGRFDSEWEGAQEADFRSSHWPDDPNVLLHLRMNERTDADGKRVLFIEEIQSDWHQTGRKRGYDKRGDLYNLDKWVKTEDFKYDAGKIVTYKNESIGEELEISIDQYASKDIKRFGENLHQNPALFREAIRYNIEERVLVGGPDAASVVPDAPFKPTDRWAMLGMKRVIQDAVEQGFDRVAWTPGEVQADRYDLSKQVESIEYEQNADQTYNIDVHVVTEHDNIVQSNLTVQQLEDTLGKEIAERIVSGRYKQGEFSGRGEYGRLKNVDLKLGGEGMKGFYDKILPKEVGKYIKKWGSRVEPTTVDGTEVWSFDITPKMRSAVMTEGQPMYLMAGRRSARAKGEPLRQAQAMKEAGESRDKIWSETGWWEIVPGQWAYEIDDSRVGVKTGWTRKASYPYEHDGGPRLNEVLDAPDIFQAYPFLLDTRVHLGTHDAPDTGALYDSENNRVILGREFENISLKSDAFKSALLHEVQHAVQGHEGFARGGRPSVVHADVVLRDDSQYQQFQNQADDLAFDGHDWNSPEMLRLRQERDDYVKSKMMDRFGEDFGMGFYRSLTGEAEARMVQKRMDMTPEQRKAEPPWQTLETMLREEGLLQEGQSVEDVLISRYDSDVMFSVAERKISPASYPDSLERVYRHTGIRTLINHPDHPKAKTGGDLNAAYNVVTDIVKDDVVDNIASQLDPRRPIVFLPVGQFEGDSRYFNALPLAYAVSLAYRIGGTVWTKSVKAKRSSATDAIRDDRTRIPHLFEGDLPYGNPQIVIVDDQFTSGGTISGMIDFLSEHDIVPTLATTLSDSMSQNILKPTQGLIDKMLAKAGVTEKEFRNAFGYGPEHLTGSEIYAYANLYRGKGGIESLRKRFPARTDGEGSGLSATPDRTGRQAQAGEAQIQGDLADIRFDQSATQIDGMGIEGTQQAVSLLIENSPGALPTVILENAAQIERELPHVVQSAMEQGYSIENVNGFYDPVPLDNNYLMMQ